MLEKIARPHPHARRVRTVPSVAVLMLIGCRSMCGVAPFSVAASELDSAPITARQPMQRTPASTRIGAHHNTGGGYATATATGTVGFQESIPENATLWR
jgi:hypothetical protein